MAPFLEDFCQTFVCIKLKEQLEDFDKKKKKPYFIQKILYKQINLINICNDPPRLQENLYFSQQINLGDGHTI